MEIVKFSDVFHKNRGLGAGDSGWAMKKLRVKVCVY